MKFLLVYITTASRAEAERICQALLQDRLVACVNIVGPISARFWWQGRIAKSREVLVLAKTRAALARAVIRKVKSVHSYAVPCVATLSISQGNPDFLKWIASETQTQRQR
jgi:periplasmic divalent cation tolerance protein